MHRALTPFVDDDENVLTPNGIAQGGWGPTLGGHVIGGLLARAIERDVVDAMMQPARLTVDILRRVAMEPVEVAASVLRTGRRMQAMDATMTQRGELVARASALYLRRGVHPDGTTWTTPLSMPPRTDEPSSFDESMPMFVQAFDGDRPTSSHSVPWQHTLPRYAWVRQIRPLVGREELSPFVRAAMAADVTGSITNFSTSGLAFINADYTLTLSRLPEGPYIGLAAVSHYGDAGVTTGTATLLDASGPIGSATSSAIANLSFSAAKARATMT